MKINTKKLDVKGFSHEVVLLLIVVIFAIAGVAYLVGSHADNPTTSSSWATVKSIASPYSDGQSVQYSPSPYTAKVYQRSTLTAGSTQEYLVGKKITSSSVTSLPTIKLVNAPNSYSNDEAIAYNPAAKTASIYYVGGTGVYNQPLNVVCLGSSNTSTGTTTLPVGWAGDGTDIPAAVNVPANLFSSGSSPATQLFYVNQGNLISASNFSGNPCDASSWTGRSFLASDVGPRGTPAALAANGAVRVAYINAQDNVEIATITSSLQTKVRATTIVLNPSPSVLQLDSVKLVNTGIGNNLVLFVGAERTQSPTTATTYTATFNGTSWSLLAQDNTYPLVFVPGNQDSIINLNAAAIGATHVFPTAGAGISYTYKTYN
jgi:hypothetical protein